MPAASGGAVLAKGLMPPHSFQLIDVANAATDKNFGDGGTRRAAPVHLRLHFRHPSVRAQAESALRARGVKAVEDVNALDPQPDFVLFGGDLAQLGRPKELELGAKILDELKAPVKMMVGEHDWFYDMGENVAGDVRSAQLLVRLEGRSCRGADERA